jgi:transposase
MDVSLLLSLGEGLMVERVEHDAMTLTVFVCSTSLASACPLCQKPSAHLHSHYERVVADLPCGGRQVRLLVCVPKFRCKTPTCPRKVFAERLAPLIEPWARQTTRLIAALQAIGLATCGEGGARLADKLSLPTSPTTLLRRIMALPTEPVETVCELGIDDFSFRRRRRFGTILVDLERHHILDLLPDRTSATAAAWMERHPEIELVSRDRGGDYAAAARLGAPQARQVADRFHLAQNLTEIVEEILARCRAEIRRAAEPPGSAPEPFQTGEEARPRTLVEAVAPAAERLSGRAHLAHHAERLDRYQQLVELRQAGLTTKEVARRLGMGERTVRYWCTRGIPYGEPELRRKRPRAGDPCAAYLTERWGQGCQNGLELWRELQAKGYRGSSRTVYRILASLRETPAFPRGQAERAPLVPETPLQRFSAQEAVWLFVRAPTDLDDEERATLSAICQASSTAQTLYELTQAFLRMLRRREGEGLETWLKQVSASQIPELRAFGQSITHDKAAVLAGLTLPQNNGMVEGFVTKLKLIKRTMYGRAGFALLRQRVLHAA